jgi:hypothetical protein
MATKIFRRKNDAQIVETWAPVLENHGVKDNSRKDWLAEYCHNHAINENAGSLNESAAAPGLFYQLPGSISAIGNPVAPTSTTAGSGDKFPSLLPVAIQVATKTIAFDLVPVVPMDTPVGFLPYLDYVYQGGNVGSAYEPFLIKIDTSVDNVTGTFTEGEYIAAGDFKYMYVGKSRFDGHPIFKVVTGSDGSTTVAAHVVSISATAKGAVAGTYAAPYAGFAFSGAVTSAAVQLVSALENHISGFTASSDDSFAQDQWTGPYQPATGGVTSGMKRADGEASKYRQMGLRMFTKFVEAKGEQVAISATVEQIQDLNKVWNYDVISMLENVATNEIAQNISKKLMDNMFSLGAKHMTKAKSVEGVSNIDTLNLTAGGGFENTSTLQRRVATKVLELANLIYHRGRFGAGTFIVTNGRIASALADISGYALAPFSNDLPSTAGQLYPAGKVYGLTIYVDPNLSWSDGRILIGRKGSDEEPGLKFMPYIIAESLQTISEGTMSPKIAMKSRYAVVEAGWYPESQYLTMSLSTAQVDKLIGATPAI